MSKFQATKINGLVNDTVNLAEKFVDGEKFTKVLSQNVMKTFDLENQHIVPKDVDSKEGFTYDAALKTAKNILSIYPPIHLKDDILFLKIETPLAKMVKAVIVRYINICHHQRYIIVVNDEIIYIPEHLRSRDREELGRYVKLALLSYQDRSKNKLVRQIKSDARMVASSMTKTVVQA